MSNKKTVLKSDDSKSKVSIIMNCYNGEQYLREAIDSTYNQTYENWEIIFWDNNSNDSSAEIAKSYDDKVKYFKSDKTVSLGQARSWALQKATGDYITFLDVDDILLQKKLEMQVAVLDADPAVGMVYSDAIYFSGDNKENSFKLYRGMAQPSGMIFPYLLKKYHLCVDAVMIRKEAYDSIGEGFDKRFNFVEEADVFMRISYQWKTSYINELLVMYRMHERSMSSIMTRFFPEEMQLVFEKLVNNCPGIEEEFRDELRIMKAYIQHGFAIEDFKKGRKRIGRKRLTPYLAVKKRFYVPYMFSFLPFVFLKTFLRLTQRQYSR